MGLRPEANIGISSEDGDHSVLPVPPPYETADPLYKDLSDRELLEQHIETNRLQNISMLQVNFDEAYVDPDHMALIKDELHENGQQYPVTLRARLDENGGIKYDIIDGFHRCTALAELHAPWIKAVVEYGMTDERMYDLRIIAAQSARAVQFTRTARWMQRAFDSSEWKEKGLTVLQLFSLAQRKEEHVNVGSNLGLSKQEANDAYEWACQKARQWGKN